MNTDKLGEMLLTSSRPNEDADSKAIRTEFPQDSLVRWLSVYVIGVMGAGMTFGTLYLGKICEALMKISDARELSISSFLQVTKL